MKKIFTLIAACVFTAMSAMAAEGDKTTNVDIDFSNPIVTSGSSPKNSISGAVGKMVWDNQWTMAPNITDGILRFGNFTGSVELQGAEIKNKDVVTITFDLAFGKLNGKHVGFTLKDADGGVILTQYFNAYGTSFDNSNPLNLSWDAMYNGSNTVLQERCVYFTITLDYATNKITTKTKCYKSGTSKAATNGSFEATLPSTKPIKFFELTGNINNTDRYHTFDNLKIVTTEGNYESATANYKVKFICDGNEIKSSETRSGDVGATISTLPADKESFFAEGVKYIYVSDDATGKTVAEDGTTVLTINYRKAETYNYNVVAIINDSPKETITSGTGLEGETVSYAYPKYVLDGAKLYSTGKQSSNPWWGKSLVLNANNKTEQITYSNPIDNVVYYSEAEKIEGATSVSSSNADIRCSGKAGGYGNVVTVTTLPAGKYTLYTSIWGNSGTTINFFAGETNILAADCTGSISDHNSEEFICYGNTTITFSGSNSSHPVDYIYIVKTGDAPTTVNIAVNDYGTASYVTPCALDFTESGLTAYIATAINETAITLEEVTKVPAGQAIVVKGETSDVKVIAEAPAIENNLFQAGAGLAVTNAYALSKTDGKFHSVGEGVAIPVGKAYITLPAATAKALALNFGGEATGISNATAAQKMNGAAYNILGQKVSKNAKGLIIINGKKVRK